ncbi:MAG TPA: peptidase domain-containing ABC transporter [Stenomitos sp.]
MVASDVIERLISEISEISVFSMLSRQQIQALLDHLKIVPYSFGDLVCEEGQAADTLYLVVKGSLKQFSVAGGEERSVGQVQRGQTANLRAVLVDGINTYGMRASEDCSLIQVPAALFVETLDLDPKLRRYLERLTIERSLQTFRRLLQANDIPFPIVKDLIASLEERETAPGQVIVAQGGVPDGLYIVRSGRCRISVETSADNGQLVGYYEEGQFFGTECLLERLQSLQTVTADRETTVFWLAPDVFRMNAINAPLLLKLFNRKELLRTRQGGEATASSEKLLERWIEQGSSEAGDETHLVDSILERINELAEVADVAPELPAAPERPAPADEPSAEALPPRRTRRRKRSADRPDPELEFERQQARKKRYIHVRQRDEMDCGAACLAMISQYYGQDLGLRYFRDAAQVSKDGTSLLALAGAAEQAGFTTKGVRLSASALQKVTLPAVAHFGYHFVVLYGVDAGGVTIADPARTIERLSFEELEKRWDGILLLLEPTPRLYTHRPEKRSTYRRYLAIAKPYMGLVKDTLLASFLLSLLALSVPLFSQVVLDKVVVHQSQDLLNLIGLGMLVAVVFQMLAEASRTYLVGYVSMKLDIALSKYFYRHVLRLPMRFFANHRVGDITTRMGEVEGIRSFLTHGAVGTVLDAIMLIVYVAILVYYDWRLIFLVIGFALPLFLLVRFLTPRLQATYLHMAEQRGVASSRLVEQVSAIGIIKALAAEDIARWRWEKVFEGVAGLQFKLIKLGLVMSTAGHGLMQLGNLVILYIGAKMVLAGTLSVGQLIALVSIFGSIMQPVFRITSEWSEFQELKVRLQRLDDVFETAPESGPRRSPIRSAVLKGHVRFENVSFSYKGSSGPMVLKDLNMEVFPGQMVALVGRSGSGKSTLAQLVNRLFDPNDGRILFDGFDAREIPLALLRRHIGIVMQENTLFSGTILENIAYGDDDPDLSRVIEAATLANAHTFITKLPSGYGTQLAEGGLGLSGGQKQRIAIARALYHDPKVLIMDEATSALDAESEQAIMANFKAIVQGRTAILIAHRLNTIMNADQVFVLDEGQIVEAGTHRQLMQKHGMYYNLFSQQLNL